MRAAYEYITGLLGPARIYSAEDAMALEVFAATWAKWQDLHARLDDGADGDGAEVKLWLDAGHKLFGCFSRFGMTPLDRSRLRLPAAGQDKATGEDPDAEFARTKAG